jgi:hypothetical protein|tara:strand:+ start:198 stop:374 length:177 start_codon:yes stop_codon:yes gene_type:complete
VVRRRVAKDKKTGLPKKYLSGLKGRKRARRASIIKRMAKLYKQGKRIPKRLFIERSKL